MSQIGNYLRSFSIWDNLSGIIHPSKRNAKDLQAIQSCIEQFEELKNQDVAQLKDVAKNSERLTNRVSKQWFVSKKVKNAVKNLEVFTTAYKIANAQGLPFNILVENAHLRTVITANHLHHKISKQHQSLGLSIKIENNTPYFPVADELDCNTHQAKVKWAKLEDLAVDSNGKIENMEFLADGLEIHDKKKWDILRPLYRVETVDGKYVHIDTVTGKQEVIGPAGKNYIQLVTVKPWGWNPRGGALFGHTWIRFVIDGQLYHVGQDLAGKLVNPDFMATVPRGGKNYSTSDWVTINDKKIDYMGNATSERIFKKLEALQYYLNHKALPEDNPYAGEVLRLYETMRKTQGGTCTSAALVMFREVTGQDFVEQARPRASRLVFNPVTQKIIDAILFITPKPVAETFVRPVQAVTRGGLPIVLAHKLK